MTLFVVGVSHRTTPLAVRERLCMSESQIPRLLQELLFRGYLEEGVLLSTCNRFELYGATTVLKPSLIALQRFLSEKKGLHLEDLEGCWYAYQDEEAVRHLFEVACGLDSMIFGEAEIQGQVKNAYERTKNAGFTGPVTNRLFEKALNAAKAVREKTGITHGKASVGSHALEVARKIFGEHLPSKTLLMVGAGEIGKLVSHRFFSAGVRSILIASRSYERASHLARELGGEAVLLEKIHEILPECDIVVSSTKCPHILLHVETVKSSLSRRRGKPIFFLDLSVPRNIDSAVGRLPQSYLYHLDDLERIVATGLQVRDEDLKQCEAILEKKAAYFMEWLRKGLEQRVWCNSMLHHSVPVSS